MLKRTPLVYMVSPMALTCNHYAARCTKIGTEILRQKNSEKEENAPDSARKRRNRVRFGCWRGVQPVRTGGETRNPNQNAPDSNATHEKRKPAKPQCFRRLFGRGRRTLSRLPARSARGRAPLALARPTTRTARGAAAPCCQDIPHANEKNQVPQKRYLTFLAGAEGLEPSARGFGVDVGKRAGERGRAGVDQFLPQVRKGAVLVWCCGEILRSQ